MNKPKPTKPLSSNANKLRLLFLGDCNTCGTEALRNQTYPELVAARLDAQALNCGHTMSTTREALEYIRHISTQMPPKGYDILFVQYGLVDSWITLKAASYVLYFPDNALRHFLRAWVKKWKKYGKRIGLGHLFGLENVVPLAEYENNIRTLIEHADGRPVYLIETVPNKDVSRNPEIERYNATLKNIANDFDHVHVVETYHDFGGRYRQCYADATHINADGHKVLQDTLSALLLANQSAALSE